MRLILASTSPSRRQMLQNAGLAIEFEAPGVDEAIEEPDPARRAVALAERKAEAVRARRPDAWVLAADQVVTDGSEVWGKPSDPAEHLARLRSMRGKWHDLVTGFALLGPEVRRCGVEQTRLWVRADLDDEELQAYVDSGEGRDCAGGYAIEGRAAFLFSRIDGDWFNILGLPLLRVMDLLREQGWRFGEDR
ncbi:MAG: septum formation protein Maf [Deltaproteobacteria bacterium]|nr:septum formation protein Maf [Deltaproteobacteria bacterium]MBW2255600.1 septum formation protein Maf [Deltaproteobacteria bacterium]